MDTGNLHPAQSTQRRWLWLIVGIVLGELDDSASSRASNAYYGLSHFGVDCLVHTFGQRKMLDFVTLKLRRDNTYDQASRKAFGGPFRRIDTACVAWIKQHA